RNATEVMPQPDAQCAQRIVDHGCLVRTEEDQIAVGCATALEDAVDGGVRQELENGRGQAVASGCGLVDLDVGQSACAVAADEFGVVVNLLECYAGAAGHVEHGNASLRGVGGAGKNLEVGVRDQIGHVRQLEVEAQIRLVGTETAHRLG